MKSSITRPLAVLFLTLLAAAPAHAHHPMGDKPVSTAFEGFLSGIAHPLIGVDHLAMIVAIGVLAAAMRPGFRLAIAFVIAAMGGTALHLLGLNLPGAEPLISLSVLAVGILLVLRHEPKRTHTLALCAIAGTLHGYAYGESIFGAEPTPLTTYLIGFTFVQLLVAGIAYLIAKKFRASTAEPTLAFRPAGFVVVGVGLALLAAQIIALSLPLSS